MLRDAISNQKRLRSVVITFDDDTIVMLGPGDIVSMTLEQNTVLPILMGPTGPVIKRGPSVKLEIVTNSEVSVHTRETYWECTECREINTSARTACKACGTPAPTYRIS